MNPADQLAEYCAAWRQWSETEGRAIETGDWPQAARCQREKDGLQTRIEAELQTVCAQQGERARAEWRAVLESLMTLECENHERLSRQRSLLSAQHDELNSTTRNLRRLHASYSAQRDSVWQSYS